MIIRILGGLIILLCLANTSVSAQSGKKIPVPIPEFTGGVVELRTIYLENPRFEGLNDQQLARLLAAAARTTKAHFGLELKFTRPKGVPIEKYFRLLRSRLGFSEKRYIADFRGPYVNWGRIAKSINRNFGRSPRALSAIWQFSLPYLSRAQSKNRSRNALARALTMTMKDRLAYWARKTTATGAPYLGGPGDEVAQILNEWIYWDNLPRLDFPYEVVITNQPVISAEYMMLEAHGALRGGITVGTTSSNNNARYGSLSWISVASFLGDDEMLNFLRGGENYSTPEAIDLAGAYLVCARTGPSTVSFVPPLEKPGLCHGAGQAPQIQNLERRPGPGKVQNWIFAGHDPRRGEVLAPVSIKIV